MVHARLVSVSTYPGWVYMGAIYIFGLGQLVFDPVPLAPTGWPCPPIVGYLSLLFLPVLLGKLTLMTSV